MEKKRHRKVYNVLELKFRFNLLRLIHCNITKKNLINYIQG